jgi:DMSO/TMAO reductase YedYZ heme-binding membrane subunit
MIQRIQTLFLLLALGCMGLFYIFPFGEVITSTGDIVEVSSMGADYINKNGEIQHFSGIFMLIIVTISVLTTLVSLFLFKKRMLQIRLNVFNFIVQLGTIGIIFFYLIQATKEFGIDYNTKIMVVTPLAASILTFLAIRAIARDEALIRSIDRLR